jgi:hypothetical protein
MSEHPRSSLAEQPHLGPGGHSIVCRETLQINAQSSTESAGREVAEETTSTEFGEDVESEDENDDGGLAPPTLQDARIEHATQDMPSLDRRRAICICSPDTEAS